MDYHLADRLLRTTTLRQLQIFIAVVEHQGYTNAAKALHLTQPTVSMQIKKLSDHIGLPLFNSGHQLQLTPAGQKVLSAAQDILQRLEVLGGELASLTQDVKGELRIAVVTTAKYFMPHLLGAFIQRYPEVEPKLVVSNREKVLARLQNHQDDLFIMGRVPENYAVQAMPFLDNDLVVIAEAHHRLARHKAIALEQLVKERFLLREKGSGTRLATDQLFQQKGLQIEPYMELGSTEAIKQGVMAGLGISVMSRYNLRSELAGGRLCILDVQGFPLRRHWYAVYPKQRQLSLVAQTFLDFLFEEGADLLWEWK